MGLRIVTLLLSIPLTFASAEFSGSDYSDAMRMAVKFFGAQRCGNTYNWMLYENPLDNKDPVKPVCHTKDAHNGHDMSGGWHDCGDHIKVATTMGYAAICLLSAYDIWPKAFEDHHDTAYVAKPNGIPDILDETKVATDYFIKSLIDGDTFVYYVGDDHDHDRWVTSAFQSTLGTSLGGDPRPVSVSNNAGGAQAADYASALALMAMNYPDQAYAEKCKEAAIKLYAFAKAHPTNITIPTFYPSANSDVTDELSLAAILLYRLTKTESYKTDAVSAYNGKWESNAPLAWDTKADIAYYYIIKEAPNTNNGDPNGGSLKSFLAKNVNAGIKGANSYGIPWGFFKSNWGTNKLACGSAYAAALYAKLIEDGVMTPISGVTADAANNYTQKIIDYMLGANEFKHPFLHGYKGDMNHRVHHRNAMGRNDNPPTDVKNSASFMFASGALIGGPASQGSFENKIEGGVSYVETESGCDYNGPFIAAMANLVSKLDPKNSSIRVPKFVYQNKALNMNSVLKNQSSKIVDIRGRTVEKTSIVNRSGSVSGIYFVQNRGADLNSHAIKVLNIR